MLLRQDFFDLLARYNNAIAQPITLTFPLDTFLNTTVVVRPTIDQVNNELQLYTPCSENPQTCSVCQESISSAGVSLRGCSHVYHRVCIQTWFQSSVRCPVCRRDIREDPVVQTHSASIRTPSRYSSQLEEE
jgi:hypothetical protein